jgi:hypothetical protein
VQCIITKLVLLLLPLSLLLVRGTEAMKRERHGMHVSFQAFAWHCSPHQLISAVTAVCSICCLDSYQELARCCSMTDAAAAAAAADVEFQLCQPRCSAQTFVHRSR